MSRPTLILSPEALAAMKLPVVANDDTVLTNDGYLLLSVNVRRKFGTRAELAAFIAALLNAAVTPAPAVIVEPESNVELRQVTE